MTTEQTAKTEDRVLQLTRQFDAPREVVFRAWTDASWLVRWMGPQTCSCPFAETDLRVGGALRLAIRNTEGKDHIAHGVYQTIDAPTRLSFTWRWEQEDSSLGHEMLIDIEFQQKGDGTHMIFTQTRFPTDDSRDQHEGGWTSSFECLAERLNDLSQEN